MDLEDSLLRATLIAIYEIKMIIFILVKNDSFAILKKSQSLIFIEFKA